MHHETIPQPFISHFNALKKVINSCDILNMKENIVIHEFCNPTLAWCSQFAFTH